MRDQDDESNRSAIHAERWLWNEATRYSIEQFGLGGENLLSP